MSFDLILRVGTKLILPFILLFALYVQFHGDYGPGGGFQAGVIAAGMVILLAITFGLDAAKRIAPQAAGRAPDPARRADLCRHRRRRPAARQELSRLFGPRRTTPPHGHELGIFLVEVGVLITVSGTMIALFYAFVERGR